MSVVQLSTSVDAVTGNKGDQFKARRTAIGMSVNALAKRAGVDRGSLTALEAGGRVRDTTVAAIDKALSELEHELGMDEPSAVQPLTTTPEPNNGPHTIRVEVQGVYGAKALIFESPVEDVAVLEAMVDRVMRRLAGEPVNTPESDTPGA